jgi:Fe-S-cluster containining protein
MSRRRPQNRDHLLEKAAALKRGSEAGSPPAAPQRTAMPDAETVQQAAYRLRIQVFELSRTVALALAEKELEAAGDTPALVNSAARVATYTDQMIATLNERYKPALDCREGCSFCCRKPGVLASAPELLRVLDHVNQTFSETERAALAERARSYAQRMEGRDVNAPLDESVPCPLLVNERCSVYSARPLVCRGYNSTSVEACRTAHERSTGLVPIFALIKDVSDGATVGLEQQVGSHGLNDAMLDLGRALNIAFSAPEEDFQRSIAQAGGALAAAENKTWVSELVARVNDTAKEIGLAS